MKIVGSFLISLVGALAIAGAAVVGCSTTNNLNNGQGTSGPGETCTRTFDCKSGLVCEQNICLAAAPTTTADGGVLPTGDSGTAMTGPHLGLLNESCQVSSDCQSPLECLGQRCSVVNYGLTATGKSCTGECNMASDCCELPVGGFNPPGITSLGEWETQSVDGGAFTFHPGISTSSVRCEDILGFIGGDATICNNPANFNIDTESLAQGCFLYNTYCGSCGASGPWACTNNQCVYTAPCTPAGTVAALASECPNETRTGRGLSTTCTVAAGATMGACQAGCVADADCAGKTPTGGSFHTCSVADAGPDGTNCTCYQSSCYFKCAGDLDCASGSTCDATTHLCKTAGCMADADCVQSLGNPRAKCVTNSCQVACDNDSNCGPPATICSSGYCKASGCTSDSDCPSGGVHEFCVTSTATTYTGAITN